MELILFNPSTKQMCFTKVLTTPEDFSKGVIEGIINITKLEGASTNDVYSVIYDSTIGINTIIERKGVRTCLITTARARK